MWEGEEIMCEGKELNWEVEELIWENSQIKREKKGNGVLRKYICRRGT